LDEKTADLATVITATGLLKLAKANKIECPTSSNRTYDIHPKFHGDPIYHFDITITALLQEYRIGSSDIFSVFVNM